MESSTDDSPLGSQGLSGTGSASRLVLLPNTDDDDDDRNPLDEYATDDEDENEVDDPQSGMSSIPVTPLSPSVVFLYLLSPYLGLGAISASDFRDASVANGLTGLVVAAFLSAFCRQIWFLLARYLRKSSTEDVLIHTFARRRREARKYGLARHAFIIISGSFRILLAAMYLRDSVDTILLLRVPKSILLDSRLNVSILLSILVFVLSIPRSLAAKSIVYTTGLSVASYLAWLVAAARYHSTNGPLPPNIRLLRRGVLWNEISCLIFACTTAMTIPLAASLVAGTPLVTPASRNTRTRSFELLNVVSTVLASLLILPILIMTAPPHAPKASAPTSANIVLSLRAATLVLSVPSMIVSIVSLPPHGGAYRFIRTDLALSVIAIAILPLSLVPPKIASVLDDATLILAVFGTFLLPALAHITTHYFRRPLSIVVPHEPSSPSTPSSLDHPSSPSRDFLLQRKERLLQRSRFGKRLFWDIVVWVVLIPISFCAVIWAAGRMAHQW